MPGTPHTDLTARLGSLEIGALAPDLGDAALETASFQLMNPSSQYVGCTFGPSCRRIEDDAALEQSAGPNQMTNPAVGCIAPTTRCRPRIDDGALEAAAGIIAAASGSPACMPPSFYCGRIEEAGVEDRARHVDDDGTLEASVLAGSPTHGTCHTHSIHCDVIDDTALEAMSGLGGGPTSSNAGCSPNSVLLCRLDA
jgi:hypothetical protein